MYPHKYCCHLLGYLIISLHKVVINVGQWVADVDPKS